MVSAVVSPAAVRSLKKSVLLSLAHAGAQGLVAATVRGFPPRVRSKTVKVNKSFNGKVTQTEYQLTKSGRKALEKYWAALDGIRTGSQSKTKTS